MNTRVRVVLLRAWLAVVLFPQQAWSASSSSSVHLNGSMPGTFEGRSGNNPSGLTSSATFVGTQAQTAGSSATAHTAAGTTGAAVTAGARTLGGSAVASMADRWNCVGLCGGQPVSMALAVHFDGTISPELLNPTPGRPGVFMDMLLEYNADGGRTRFRFSATSDGNDPAAFRATFLTPAGERDVTGDLVISGNKVSYDASLNWTVPAGTWPDQFRANVNVSPFGRNDPSSYSVDFASTFSTAPFSLNPDVSFVSDGGRTTVPEPSSMLLLIALPAAMHLRWRR